MRDNFFFCYDWKMNEYIKECGIKHVTKALHPQSKKPFTLYQQTEELALAIAEFKKNSKLVRS